VPKAYHTQINDVLLTALGQTLAAWSGRPSVLVDVEGHGREELFAGVDISRTVGWFTSLFPVLLSVPTDGPGAALTSVKEQLRRIPRRGVGYGLLRWLGDDELAAQLAALPVADVCFNYFGQFDDGAAAPLLRPTQEPCGPLVAPGRARPHLVAVDAVVLDGRLSVQWSFGGVHRRATIAAQAAELMTRLRALISHCVGREQGGFTPSDFPLANLDQKTLDRLVSRGR
jgi:non-ribosomal peptide synthase protein (TIGR01720 family)